MATVAPVETKGTYGICPRYLGVLGDTWWYLLQWYPGHQDSRHDGGTVGGVGGVKGFLVAPSSPRHQQTSYNSILCLFALLFRSSFEAVASVTNIIFVTPPRRSITLSLHVMQNDWSSVRQHL